MTDLPVQAEGIDETAETPAVILAYGEHFGGTGFEGAGEEGIGIGDAENHSDGIAADWSWTWVGIIRRFNAQPELRTADGEADDDTSAGIVVAIDFGGCECGFIEIDGFGAAREGQPRDDGGLHVCAHEGMVAQGGDTWGVSFTARLASADVRSLARPLAVLRMTDPEG